MVKKAAETRYHAAVEASPHSPPRRPLPRGKPRPPSPPQPPTSEQDAQETRGLPEHGSYEVRHIMSKRRRDTPQTPGRDYWQPSSELPVAQYASETSYNYGNYNNNNNTGGEKLASDEEDEEYEEGFVGSSGDYTMLHPSPRQINWAGPQGQRWLRDDPFSVLKRNQRAYVARARSVLQRMPAEQQAAVLGSPGARNRTFGAQRTRQQEVHKERWEKFQERRREERLKELLGGHSDAAEKMLWEEAHAERPEWVSQRTGIEHELVVWDTYSRVPTRLLARYTPTDHWREEELSRPDATARAATAVGSPPQRQSPASRRRRQGGGHLVHTVHRRESASPNLNLTPRSRMSQQWQQEQNGRASSSPNNRPSTTIPPPSLRPAPSRRHTQQNGNHRAAASSSSAHADQGDDGKTLKRGVSQFVAPQYVASVRGARRVVGADESPAASDSTSPTGTIAHASNAPSPPRTPERTRTIGTPQRRSRMHPGQDDDKGDHDAQFLASPASVWEGDTMTLRSSRETQNLPSPTEGISVSPNHRKRHSASPPGRGYRDGVGASQHAGQRTSIR